MTDPARPPACPLCDGPTVDQHGRPTACGLGHCHRLEGPAAEADALTRLPDDLIIRAEQGLRAWSGGVDAAYWAEPLRLVRDLLAELARVTADRDAYKLAIHRAASEALESTKRAEAIKRRAAEALGDYAEDLRSVTWLLPVSAQEMTERDRWLADALDTIAEALAAVRPAPKETP